MREGSGACYSRSAARRFLGKIRPQSPGRITWGCKFFLTCAVCRLAHTPNAFTRPLFLIGACSNSGLCLFARRRTCIRTCGYSFRYTGRVSAGPSEAAHRSAGACDLLATLRRRELEETATRLSAETGLAYQPAAEGDRIAGMYRQRVTLSSGRFAMIDDGLSFQLVPWRPALEQRLERQVSGVMMPGGRVDWEIGRQRGLGL
jgi:Protein of unknown function (DUF3363)